MREQCPLERVRAPRQWKPAVAKQVWCFDQNGIGQSAEAASCEPLRIQVHMADTLRTVDEMAQRLRHRALWM